MPQPPKDQNSFINEEQVERIDFGAVDFPSDALSMKRLRQSFPELFDEGSLTNGYGLFFHPMGPDEPERLVRLTDLLHAERTVAEYAFYNALDPYPSETLDEECRECDGWAREELEPLYVEFKLADSPETARLLILHVEEQGAQQGKAIKSRESRGR